MGSEAELIARIHENPDDQNNWLDYAAWLEAQADPRGEFLRTLLKYEALCNETLRRFQNRDEFDEAWWRNPSDEIAAVRERLDDLASTKHLFWLVKLHRGWMDRCPSRRGEKNPSTGSGYHIDLCPLAWKAYWNDTESPYGHAMSDMRWCGPCLKYVWLCYSINQLDRLVWPYVDQDIWPRHPASWHCE